MNGSFRFLEHTADIAAEVSGGTLEELFAAAAKVWQISAADYKNNLVCENKHLNLSANSAEELLVDFLNELNFLLCTKKWFFVKISSIKIEKDSDSFILQLQLLGSADISKIKLKEEIKSVTYHQLDIKKDKNGFKTIIVFDI